MPKLWHDTIETHRGAVRTAIMQAAVRLAIERGLRGVTMSEVARATGIGRATLYKYFPDVETILAQWHTEQIAGHVAALEAIATAPGTSLDRLRLVLGAYAKSVQTGRHHSLRLDHALARQVPHAAERVKTLLRDLIAQGASVGELRQDLDADTLADFCFQAMSAAAHGSTKDFADLVCDALRANGPATTKRTTS